METLKKTHQENRSFQSQQSRNWTGTWFHEDLEKGIKQLSESCLYFTGQIEQCPTTNREHLQFFAHFAQNQRPSKLKSILPGAHVEIARNTQACIDYCTKDDTRKRGPYSIGIPPHIRQKSGKKLLVNEALELTEEELRQLPIHSFISAKKAISLCLYTPLETEYVRGEWYHGEPGTGKSYNARIDYPGAYIKAQNKWFDGYVVQSSILLDDLDIAKGTQQSFEIGHMLKIVADRYACYGEIKGGTVALRHTKFIVTSNYLPEDLWQDSSMQQAIRRRFNFKFFALKFKMPKPSKLLVQHDSQESSNFEGDFSILI